jgi:Protein of unknown function (DUF2924)
MPRPSFDREVIEVEIGRVRSLDLDALRTLWRVTFRSSPPPAFTKDLVARFLCWHIQEQAQGGLDPETAKHLDGRARGDKPGADRPRRFKPGTVLLREWASGTPSLSLQTDICGAKRPTQASRLSRGASPARAGTDRASSACGVAASQRLCRKRPMGRRHQTTSDVLFGRPSRIRLALHKILSPVMGSADHEANRSQAPTLRDLHPQIDRA